MLGALFAAGGAFVVGKLADAALSGAIAGGAMGLALGFIAIYKRYSDL